MEVEILFTDGETAEFEADTVQSVNDVAFVDGIVHTNVETLQVTG
jgi:hypothetical protein